MSRTESSRANRAARRGQPIVVLMLLLSGWVAARAAVWEMPFAGPPATAQAVQLADYAAPSAPNRSLPEAMANGAGSSRDKAAQPATNAPATITLPRVIPFAAPVPSVPLAAPLPTNAAAQLGPTSAPLAAPTPSASRVAAGHQMLWLAAVGQLPLPAVLFERRGEQPAREIDRPLARRDAMHKRWSADSWLLLRPGTAVTVRNGFSAPSYGASQVGAVIRYRLAADNPRKPSLYLRASGAVRAPHDEELAVGLAARPIARLPVLAMAELRVSRPGNGTRLRPAAALVSEFPPLDLPLGLRAEAYGQAGYVGGSGVGGSGASAFVDGQLHLTRRLARIGKMELRAGAAAWGGAQQGASRVDAGPTASLGLPIGPTNARLSADWRFRLAGRATPGSGPAITLSAGF